MKVHKTTLISDSSGDVVETVNVNGSLSAVELTSGAGVSLNWDLVITNDQGTAIFTDTGISTANEIITPALSTYFKYPVTGPLTLTGANIGDTKTVQVILYVEDD